jgi:hypothetical protein
MPNAGFALFSFQPLVKAALLAPMCRGRNWVWARLGNLLKVCGQWVGFKTRWCFPSQRCVKQKNEEKPKGSGEGYNRRVTEEKSRQESNGFFQWWKRETRRQVNISGISDAYRALKSSDRLTSAGSAGPTITLTVCGSNPGAVAVTA